MKTQPTFEKTVDVLVKAYLNDTLEHGNCSACAVGNIVVSTLGYSYHRREGVLFALEIKNYDNWYSYLLYRNSEYGLNQIKATGYTLEDIINIEMAFESAAGNSRDEMMFNGLIAVVDVLGDIHGIDLEKKEAAKLLFVKA